MQRSLALFLMLIVILIQPSRAQELNLFLGWDLTYQSVLEKNKVASDEFIRKWLNSSYQGADTGWQTPARKWLAEWKGEPIVSSVLIDFPAFHAAEHSTEWLVRTEKNAYYWEIIEDATPRIEKRELPLSAYDEILAQVSAWQQAALPKLEDLPAGLSPEEKSFRAGYIGFLSFYEKGNSRQMLLSLKDFMDCTGKKCTPESRELKVGRVLQMLTDIPEDPRCSEKNYQPKSTAELAAMIPRRLVDELIKSSSARYDNEEMPDYIRSVEIKIRQSGVKMLPVLTEYLNDYKPESGSACDRDRFHTAERLAGDIDRFKVRLRGTKEGQLTIEALERGIERLAKFETYNGSLTLFLDQLKGINSVDSAIQDTFRLNKKIKLSDKELIEFTNFLIARDPTYPSRGDYYVKRDRTQINENGISQEVYILKNPYPFYQAYSEFKKSRAKKCPLNRFC